MKNQSSPALDRRHFLTASAGLLAGTTLLPSLAIADSPFLPAAEDLSVFGPRAGYTSQISIVVSMMDWMRRVMLNQVKGMSVADLDYLHDPKANTIGSMLLHLAAVNVLYHDTTLNGLTGLSEANKTKWDVAWHLGDAGRQQIKGNNLDYYVNALTEVRQQTLDELKHRDDDWLMTIDPKFFGNKPTNNYCKWFHVVEHESNHNGQIKWIKGRLPDATATKD